MTAIAAAFAQAGYAPPSARLHGILLDVCRLTNAEWAAASGAGVDPEADRQRRRLMQVATDTLKRSPRNWDGAKDAFFKQVRGDAGLLWELFAPYRAQAVQLLLTEAASELRELERQQRLAAVPSAGGQVVPDDHQTSASRANGDGGRGHTQPGSHSCCAPSARSGMDAVAAVARLSLLDTFKINGSPIGDLTTAEAIKWAGARERDARFVRLLTQNLPPDAVIRKFRTGDDTQAIYEQAAREIGNAE